MTNGVTFYFMRHGETYFNRYGHMQGWANSPLTPEGIENIRASARGLKDIQFDAVYSSDLMRTIQTAEIVLEENNHADGLTIEPMAAFREVGFGSFEGLEAKDIWKNTETTARLNHDLPEGTAVEIKVFLDTLAALDPYKDAEDYKTFWFRVESGLLTLLNRHAGTGQNILVVCHGLTIRNLLEGLVADFDEKDALENASISIVDYANGQFHLKAFNQTSHFIQ